MCKTFVYRCTNCNKTVKSIVELEKCPYCGFSAWWDDWHEIQIIEIEENKMIEWQDTIIEPNKKMTKKDIIKKVKQIEQEKIYVRRCLSARVCPSCGRNLLTLEAINESFRCDCGFKR